MITILNGKLTIPESERFIGFAGDNLARTIEFLLSGLKEADRIYRLYLTFDDGTVNYFVLPHKVVKDGVLLTWNVKKEHIYKSGNVRVQIKAFSDTGVVYHTRPDTFIVGNSAEFSDSFSNGNSEFLEYEEMLNNLKAEVSAICTMTPYIGDNGNWYIYDSDKGGYIDSGRSSFAEGQTITVDQTYSSKSENPQSGKAVAQALAGVKLQVEEGAIELKHFSEELLIPEDKLEGIYWENENMLSVMSYEFLDELLQAECDKTGGWSKTIFRLGFIPSFPQYGILGSDEYIGITDTASDRILLVNIANGSLFTYEKGSSSVYKVSASLLEVDREYNPQSENAQSGKAVAQALENVQADVAEGSVELKHLSEELLIPEDKLEGIYWENENMLSVMSYEFLDEMLQAECNKTEGWSKTIFRLGFIPTFPQYSILGSDEYIGITDTVSDRILLINIANGSLFTYEKGSGLVCEVSSADDSDKSFINAGTFTSYADLDEYPFEEGKLYFFRLKGVFANSSLEMSNPTDTLDDYFTGVFYDHGSYKHLYFKYADRDTTRYFLYSFKGNGIAKHTVCTDEYMPTDRMVSISGAGVAKAIANLQSQNISDTNNYYTVHTVEGALEEIGETLSGMEELLSNI